MIFWKTEHDIHIQFEKLKQQIIETTENKNYNLDLQTRINCDASRAGLGTLLEQQTADRRKTIALP